MIGEQLPRAVPTFDPFSTSFDKPFGQQSTSSVPEDTSTSIEDASTTATQTAIHIPPVTLSEPTSTSASLTTTYFTSSSDPSSQYNRASETDSQSTSSATSIAITQNQHNPNSSNLSTGSLAAAIVLPIIAVFLLAFGACFFRRRRKAQNARDRAGSGGKFLPLGIRERWGSLRSSSSSHFNTAPEMVNATNNAYYTGLDTSSHGSRSQRSGESARRSEGDPPPPYPPVSIQTSRFSHPTTVDIWHLAALDPPRPSSRSAQSFTSTLYSDTASVHSARAARRSFGPNMIQPAASETNLDGRREGEGPFGDDANSPVSPLSDV